MDDAIEMDEEAYFDFGQSDAVFGDMIFDFSGELQAADFDFDLDEVSATTMDDAPATAEPATAKLHRLRYDIGGKSLKRFVSDPYRKPSRVSKIILEGLDDLEDLYDAQS